MYYMTCTHVLQMLPVQKGVEMLRGVSIISCITPRGTHIFIYLLRVPVHCSTCSLKFELFVMTLLLLLHVSYVHVPVTTISLSLLLIFVIFVVVFVVRCILVRVLVIFTFIPRFKQFIFIFFNLRCHEI